MNKFIELIFRLFQYNSKKRNELYLTEITTIKDEDINKLLNEIEEYSNFDILIQNDKIKEIYKLLYFSMKK